jgi:hypothetical protein
MYDQMMLDLLRIVMKPLLPQGNFGGGARFTGSETDGLIAGRTVFSACESDVTAVSGRKDNSSSLSTSTSASAGSTKNDLDAQGMWITVKDPVVDIDTEQNDCGGTDTTAAATSAVDGRHPAITYNSKEVWKNLFAWKAFTRKHRDKIMASSNL